MIKEHKSEKTAALKRKICESKKSNVNISSRQLTLVKFQNAKFSPTLSSTYFVHFRRQYMETPLDLTVKSGTVVFRTLIFPFVLLQKCFPFPNHATPLFWFWASFRHSVRQPSQHRCQDERIHMSFIHL